MRIENAIYRQLKHWAEKNQNIHTVILTGSRANPNTFVDLFSDYDVAVFVEDLDPFLKDDAWLATFGKILVYWPPSPKEENQKVTRLALFDDGVRIDFQISNVEKLKQMLQSAELPAGYDNGYTILIDKDSLTKSMPLPTQKAYLPAKPTQDEYLAVVYHFWWDSTYVAKSLWRDELYFAKYMLDSVMRFDYLRKMLEWYIGIQYDWSVNPNKQGRWFKRYLDKETWLEVETTFTGADIGENWQALFNMASLFRRIAREIADTLGYSYPFEVDKKVTTYLSRVKNLNKLAEEI